MHRQGTPAIPRQEILPPSYSPPGAIFPTPNPPPGAMYCYAQKRLTRDAQYGNRRYFCNQVVLCSRSGGPCFGFQQKTRINIRIGNSTVRTTTPDCACKEPYARETIWPPSAKQILARRLEGPPQPPYLGVPPRETEKLIQQARARPAACMYCMYCIASADAAEHAVSTSR